LGASLALVFCTALGVFAGRTVLKHIPLALLHKISGLIFLLLAVVAAFHTYDRLLAVGLLPPSWQALIIK
jgi:putative Ca2+/H+ antiporter (TMEM165/GDT1 family)